MSMIAGGDQSARNAFLTTLRDDSSRRVLDTPLANPTQELDPGDILEVKDLANAIERAERSMLTPLPVPASSWGPRQEPAACSRELDMFEALGSSAPPEARSSIATDDTAGPALHAPVIPTPVPPALAAVARSTPIPPPPATIRSATPSAPIIYVNEEDAYFQPAPRIRSLADESLQMHRPEPTLLVRAKVRRRTATWVAASILGLAALFMGGAFVASELGGRQDPAAAAPPAISTTTIATATIDKPASAPVAAEAKTEEVAAESKAQPAAEDAKPKSTVGAKAKASSAKPTAKANAQDSTSAVPTFDVNSLPSAKRR